MADSDKKANKHSKTKSRSRRSSARYDDAQDEDEAYANTKVKRKKSKGTRVGIYESPTHAKGTDSPKRRLKGSGSTTDGSESPSLPKELNYEYFEQLEGNLRRAGELLEEHGRGIVWQAADVIACIPEYCPPRRYGTKLCRCNTCCERCCVDEEHQLRGFHSNVRDQATDVPDEEGLTLSGSSDTSITSLLQDVSSEEGISKASARLAVASREAKRALRLAKQFRAAARTIDSLECSNESEHQMRALYTKELMDKAVFYAKKANEALAGYAALRRALRGVAGTTSGEELSRLDALEDAQRRLPYYPSHEPTYFQGERPPYGPLGQGYGFDGPRGAPGPLDAQRLRWASAPVVGHPPSVQTALNLSKMADMVMSKAQQASEEALRFQRVSEEALGEAKMLEGLLEPSTACTGAEITKDAKGGRIVVKIKPPPVHMSSKKVGTHRATKDKGLITDICDECFHDNCGSYPAGPREIEQIIDEGVGKPRYTKDMNRGQMMSPRIPEIIYELSEQSLDMEVIPSERCKGTQSPLSFDSVPSKKYHCSHAIASTNDSASKQAPRNKMLDTMQEEAMDKQVRHEGMPKHSKHMYESGYAPPKKRKAAEKAHDATEVHSSRRLSSTTDWMTHEDAQSTSKRHDIKKASGEKRTNPDSHRTGSDAHLKVLPSDTYVFMAATAAIAGGDAKNPKASTAAVKDSKKMGKEAGSAETTVRNDADYAKSKYKQVIASPDYIPEEKHIETRPAGADGFYSQQLAFAVGQNAVGSSSSGMDMASCALDDVRQLGQEPAELVVPKKLAFGADDWTIVSPLEIYSERNVEPPNVSRPGRSEDLTASESAQVDSRSERLYNDPQTRELHDDSTEEDLREPEGKASWSQQQEGEQQERESSERDQPEELQDDELPELELPEEEPPEEGSPGEEISEQEYLEEEAPVDENANAVEVPEPEPNEEVQQALGDRQDRGMQEVIELQNVDYELQSRPHAPLRGPDIRDFNFWDLDGPAVLYPESRLVFALAFVAGMWVLYLLFTTRATPNSKPRLDLFTALATAHEIPRERIMAEPFAVNDLKTKATAATEMESIVSVRPRFLYICDTLYCRESALHLARTLGEDPCSNFYNYACGKLTRKWSPMVGSALSTDAFIVDEAAKLTANYILNQEHPGMKAARNLLEACLDHEHDEQWGQTELSELFFEYFGSSWPAENNAVTMEAVWVIAGRLARDLKLEVLARVSVGVHPEDNSSTVPTIDEPVLLYRRADFKETGYSEMLKTAIEQAVMFISPATNGAPYVSSIKTTMELLADMVSTDSAEAKRHRLTKIHVLPTGMRTFLRTVFLDSVRVAENVDILVKSMRFFENLQGSRSSLLDPQAVFNYVGFRVMVHFAAFLPQPNVRRLRALEANYLLPENASAQDFCTREVERVFPAIYTHAFALQTTNLSNWLSAWSKELKRIVTQAWAPKPAPVTAQNDAHVPRHRLDSLKVEDAVPQWILNDSSFGPYAQGLERQLSVALNLDPSNSLKRLCSFSKMLRQDEIEQALQGAFENRSVGSLFGTDAKYDALTHTIYVPLVTVNWSLPADSIAFAVHAARYAVRVFKALAPMLRQEYTRSSEQPNNSEVYSKGYQEQPNATTRCLVEQYENASRNLKSAFLYKMTDRTLLGPALLDQTTALVQAYSVFKEKLRARRFEDSNFRLIGLPHLTPEQLFFVAYGQDNCEVSDTVHRRRQWHEHGELPPEDRVNIPLMQFEEFARVFACNDTAPMAADRLCPMAHMVATYD
ncbi:hypothetical protein HPB52_002551 [Rhipicephalus sanguineus]|uniref:Uncharacterized protein n=1 Tax=Rhipicephalus sanguineus TaxID=34632 RepID=A0A9D4T0V7_RHISA|nr:hypothetical protein HPB52_002551 [Rhipicephalus sanguineus]